MIVSTHYDVIPRPVIRLNNFMTTHSDGFEELCQGMANHSPITADALRTMDARYGAEKAYHAAFVITCLKLRETQVGYVPLQNVGLIDLQHFEFFALAKGNTEALDLFTTIFLGYQRERYLATGGL